MRASSLSSFLTSEKARLSRGPIAIILVEDSVEIASTVLHHIKVGFETVIVLMPEMFALPEDVAKLVWRINYDVTANGAVEKAVNAVIEAATDQWVYYCFNAEYLFFPFSETRSVGEMLTFHASERRNAMLTYVIDLYADDLAQHPSAVSLENAYLDKSGYYALARNDPDSKTSKDRQLDFFGSLRWRFEEHIPKAPQKIDRIGLFRAKPGLRLRSDHTFSDEEYNTFACPWHNNMTAAICSFRAAKALKSNPGSAETIGTFKWHHSVRFDWRSRQLLDLGLIEPGQWF